MFAAAWHLLVLDGMKHLHVCVIALTACCGHVKPDDIAPDAGEVVVDSPPAAPPRCDPDKPFGAPVRLDLGSNLDEAGARLTVDELTLFFSRTDPTRQQYDLFVATRASRDDAFGNVRRIDELASAGQDRDPAPFADGAVLYFQRDGEIFVSTRTGMLYGAPALIASVNTASAEITPFASASGLFYDGAGDLRFAPFTATGEVGTSTTITALASLQEDYNPVLSGDELTILWGSRRVDNGGSNDGEIWIAHRPSIQAPFGDLAVVREVSTAGSDGPDWLSADGCVLYLESNVSGTSASIYVAKRPL